MRDYVTLEEVSAAKDMWDQAKSQVVKAAAAYVSTYDNAAFQTMRAMVAAERMARQSFHVTLTKYNEA